MKNTSRGAYNSQHTSSDNEPHRSLANAIIMQACADYQKALEKNDADELSKIESFFYSHWFAILTALEPDELIKLLRKR